MARLLRRVDSILPRRAAAFGGKAKNLASLARAGFPVPLAFALSSSVGEAFLLGALYEKELPSSLLAGGPIDAARLEEIAAKVRRAPLPGSLLDELPGVLKLLHEVGTGAVAVRSSGAMEDQEAASAAGIHTSVLNVRSEEAVQDAIRECWASLFTPDVFAYVAGRGVELETSVGVVLQSMVDADVSGVLFTANPLTGDASEMMVNAAYGLGPSVVDSRVSPDTIRLDKATRGVRDRVLGDKASRLDPAPEGGLVTVDVPNEARAQFALGEGLEQRLVDLGLRVEGHFRGPRDIEFAVEEGELRVLQARPITTPILPSSRRWKRRGSQDRSAIVWSNINVGEALPGAATPLTWSVLGRFSDLGFRRAFGSLGCTVPRDAELVGDFRGRIYLNLSELMGILSQVPGLRPRTLLALGGGGELERLEEAVESRSSRAFLARLPLTLRRFSEENYRIGERIEEFEGLFLEEHLRLSELDFRLLSPAALSRTLRDIERLLDESGAIMLTAYGNLLASVVLLSGLLHMTVGKRADGLQRDLLAGVDDVDSAAPGLALRHIAEIARGDHAARAMIIETKPSELSVESLPEGPTRRALSRFLEAYGHRGRREAELSEPRWSEDPSLLFAALSLYLGEGHRNEPPHDLERRQRSLRGAALEELERHAMSPVVAAIRRVVALVHRFVRMRERLRAHVTQVLGLFRTVALDTSLRMERREPGVGKDAAFYLTIPELHAWLRGSLPEVGARVEERRRQHARNVAMPDPPDTFAGFPPPSPQPTSSGDRLAGLGASSGEIEGVARVLESPRDVSRFQAGEILVVSAADVGWGPLFLVAGAVVTDLGGPLSHAAIVLREYGVPAVFNVKLGTRTIRSGDTIRVDGDRGVVDILERAAASR